MKFVFTKNTLKIFNKLDKKVRSRVLEKIHFWQQSKDPLSFAKSLHGNTNYFRFRVGLWRIIVVAYLERDTLKIVKIGNRSDIYDHLFE